MEQHPHYFIGLTIPEDIQSYILAWGQKYKESLPFKTWIGLMDYHLTLVFLGGVSKDKIDKLVSSLTGLADVHSPFKLQVSETNIFGKPDSPRVFWLGINESQPLFQLQSSIFKDCRELGTRLDARPYRPHITIAKGWRGGGSFSQCLLNQMIVPFEENTFNVESFALFQIHLNIKPKYEPIHIFKLQGKG